MQRFTRDLAWQLSDALVQGDFRLDYQPEYDLRTSTVVGLEALARWTHPKLGELEPDTFIPIAEQSETIGELGRWVIDTATAEYASWATGGHAESVVLRMNVSTWQLTQPGLVATFRNALERHGLTGDRVCAEITESAPIADPTAVLDSVRGLQQLGVTVALDDLANGYSTLGALRLLPVDVIKVDRSLVAGIDTDRRAASILGAVLTMAGELGATVVAEGVENAREVAALLALGCYRAQGHYLARPMSASEIPALLAGAKPAAPARRRPRPYPTLGASVPRP